MIASWFDAAACAVVAAAFFAAVGWPLARSVLPGPLAAPAAPALGFATATVAAMLIFRLVDFSRTNVVVWAAGMLAVAVALLRIAPRRAETDGCAARVPAWVVLAAALLALAPAAAVAPKVVGEAVRLSPPIFDHAKVAIIDGIVRLGLPPTNPFFAETGVPDRLAYYYLWYVAAAQLAVGLGVTGWEADIGLTWFTAFAALMLTAGLACVMSGRSAAAMWVVPLAAAGSMRATIDAVPGLRRLDGVIEPGTGFSGFLFQSAWVPQHLAAAASAVLAVVLLLRVAERHGRGRDLVTALAATLTIAATFSSSSWIGGIALPLALAASAVVLLAGTPVTLRRGTLVRFVAVGVGAVLLVAPLLIDQVGTISARAGGPPIVITPAAAFSPTLPIPDTVRRAFDLIGYWLVTLPVEFPAVYPAGIVGIAMIVTTARHEAARRIAVAAAILCAVGLVCSWLLVSTLGVNNDLGLRTVLPSLLVLNAAAAAALSDWTTRGRRVAVMVALSGVLLGAADTVRLMRSYVQGVESLSARAFSDSVPMWEAVRRHVGPAERVANDPLFLSDLTPWPVNLSWALLSNRGSCFAGRETAVAYAPLSTARREALEAAFVRIFAGEGTPDDLALLDRHDCAAVVVTARDGAWTREPFASNPSYRLVDDAPGRWRIYKRAASTPTTPSR